MYRARREHFAKEIVSQGLPLDEGLLVEAYEISEYARQPSPSELLQLFPGIRSGLGS